MAEGHGNALHYVPDIVVQVEALGLAGTAIFPPMLEEFEQKLYWRQTQ